MKVIYNCKHVLRSVHTDKYDKYTKKLQNYDVEGADELYYILKSTIKLLNRVDKVEVKLCPEFRNTTHLGALNSIGNLIGMSPKAPLETLAHEYAHVKCRLKHDEKFFTELAIVSKAMLEVVEGLEVIE